MKGEPSLHHKLGHLGLEGSTLHSQGAPQPQAEPDEHGELVEEEQGAGDEEPEQPSGGVEAVEN